VQHAVVARIEMSAPGVGAGEVAVGAGVALAVAVAVRDGRGAGVAETRPLAGAVVAAVRFVPGSAPGSAGRDVAGELAGIGTGIMVTGPSGAVWWQPPGLHLLVRTVAVWCGFMVRNTPAARAVTTARAPIVTNWRRTDAE
jgi:hypothetical protein